jgi:phage FluMu gp28-like protein
MLPYQLDWIDEPARFAVWNKSRQIGGSHSTAAGCVLGSLLSDNPSPQVVLSASQALSDEVLAKVRWHCEKLAELGYPEAINYTVNRSTEVAWSASKRVIALPANPRTARSFTGCLWLDECAYFQDPEGIRDAAFPIAMRGGWRIRALSTPNGAEGLWHELVTNPQPGWKVHSTTIDQATELGLKIDIDALHTLCGGDERIFNQWFRCSFIDGNLQYIPTALVGPARDWEGSLPSLADADWYAGLDVGRNRDATALAIVGVGKDGIAWVVDVFTARRTDFAEQKAMIRTAREEFQWNTLHVDETGLGMNLAEDLVKEFGESEVIPVRFDVRSKEDLFTRAFRYHRNGAVRYPRGEMGATLAREAISLRRVVSDAGNICYEFPRTADGHGDHFTALTLALKGAGEPPPARGVGVRPLFAVA